MGWEEIATPEAVDLAERALVAALTTWSDASEETFGFEIAQILDDLPAEEAHARVLICAVTIAGIALTDVLGHFENEHPARVEILRSAADTLRGLGGSTNPNAGVREPRTPRPESPSTAAGHPDDLE